MPTAATHVTLTPDTQYILTAGVYKPRVRCYDTTQLSMKFERCVSSEGILNDVICLPLTYISGCYDNTL